MSSLTFGPKWVRDLSSGDTGAAAPPNTPPPRKYKLAEFRYGREEMLALVSDIYELPLGLKEFEDIINERPIPPLAMIPLSEEEERCQMGGVNSLLVLKMTGRGTSGLRGKGGARGRGRGRGCDYQISRSASVTDEGFSQRPWSDAGHTRGGAGVNLHRPLGRGESVDSSVRPGYEPRQRLISGDGTISGRTTEYWRSNSHETSPGGSGGGITPTDEEGWPYKPWAGKKGSADNNRNWRDPKEPEPGDLTKPKPAWNRTNSNHVDHSNSSLPEWCNDDCVEDNIPGSFDASGQFRSFKVKSSLGEKSGERNSNEDIVLDPSINDKNLSITNNIPNELEKTNGLKLPDSTLSPRSLEATKSLPQEENEKPIDDKESEKSPHIGSKNTNNGIDLSNEKIDKSEKLCTEKESSLENLPPEEVRKPPPSLSDRGFSSGKIQSLEKLKLADKKEDEEDDGLNIEHLTSMVEILDESDEEELLKHDIRLPIVTESSAALDPSIVFAKKAEPGKSITGLQDWIYRDPQGEIQGPFTNDEMLEWFKAGYFTMGLLVRRVCDEIFLPLGDVMKLWGRVPFIAKEQRPPITNQVLLQHQQQQTQLQRLLQQQQQHQQQQVQQQQQMREALLKQLQVGDGTKSNDILSELSVWGDSVNPSQNSTTSPWNTRPEQNTWNAKKSPPNVINLRQIEEEQQHLVQVKAGQQQNMQTNEQQIEKEEQENRSSPTIEAVDKPQDNACANDMNNNNNEQKPEKEIISEKEEEEKDTSASVESGQTRKKNKKKNKNKENKEENADVKKRQGIEQKQAEMEDMQRNALEALKQQQHFQQQKVEQHRHIEEQNRREEELRQKQQQQQQVQVQQEMLYQKYKQDQQRQQIQHQQQQQQQAMASTWNRVTPTTSAPSLAEIQRIQEKKEAEMHEHMKVLHHEQMLQQQQHQRARWTQQQGYQQHQQHRVKSLVEIQAEEARKTLQMQQQHQVKQHQMRQQQQQQQQNYNSLPWNAAGQPIHAKPSKNDYNASFWDEVAGIHPSHTNGSAISQHNKGQQNPRKGYNEFPPMSTNKSANKRDTKEQEIISRIFQVPTPSSDFISWVERNLPAVKKAIDVPTVVSFLQDVESPYEIHEYMRSYLGDSNEQKQFVHEFLERRNKTKKNQDSNHATNIQVQSGNGVNMPYNDDDGFEEAKRNKKKKKMQKVDPNLLGFQCNAAPELLNRAGEIESVSELLSRGKK